ncbi:hypothetical protein Tsubulata_030652 [Turnera subulata]|uniref:rRNA N-glycosylase n=1 Tax=Turnera subulata TaxID=218843 RepID=A0A9Q0FSP8_9ROSI|nr:hypothetical protein Tsubulata_030652 [Turnera subulata]
MGWGVRIKEVKIDLDAVSDEALRAKVVTFRKDLRWGELEIAGTHGQPLRFDVLPPEGYTPVQLYKVEWTAFNEIYRSQESFRSVLTRHDIYLIGYEIPKEQDWEPHLFPQFSHLYNNKQYKDMKFHENYADLEKKAGGIPREHLKYGVKALKEVVFNLNHLDDFGNRDKEEARCTLVQTQMLPESIRFPHVARFTTDEKAQRLGRFKSWIPKAETNWNHECKHIYKCTDPGYKIPANEILTLYDEEETNPFDKDFTGKRISVRANDPYYSNLNMEWFPPTKIDTREKLHQLIGIVKSSDFDERRLHAQVSKVELQFWKAKFLSVAARVTLNRSVLSSLPLYPLGPLQSRFTRIYRNSLIPNASFADCYNRFASAPIDD